MSIAEFVKERRKKLGMTQVVLADRAGVGLRFLRELSESIEDPNWDDANVDGPFFKAELQVLVAHGADSFPAR